MTDSSAEVEKLIKLRLWKTAKAIKTFTKQVALKTKANDKIEKFRREYQEFRYIPTSVISRMLKLLKAKMMDRRIEASESFLMAGTLIILITCLFMNAGAIRIVNGSRNMEQIVMNSIIASGTGGLYVVARDKISNEYKHFYRSSTRIVEHNKVDTALICGGVLAGLVSVTSTCHTIALHNACIVGLCGSALYAWL